MRVLALCDRWHQPPDVIERQDAARVALLLACERAYRDVHGRPDDGEVTADHG